MGHEDQRRSAPISRIEFSFSEGTKKFLQGLIKSPIGEASIGQKLDAIIDTQKQLEIRLGLLETRAENIHSLVFDLATSLITDPEKIKQMAASVKAVREKLQTSIDNQTKEN